MQTTSGSRGIWPLAAVCCLALLLFVICAAVVLALIPVYLPTREISPAVDDNRSNAPFYLQYSATTDGDSGMAGDLEDLAALKTALGYPADVNIAKAQTATTGVDRRKRSFFGLRPKRDIVLNIAIEINFIAVQCNSQCLLARKKFKTDLASSKEVSNVKCTINGGPLGKLETAALTWKFIGMTKAKPAGFRGAPPSLVFTTTKSGEFTDSSIWDNEMLPSGPCEIVIAAGTVVTLSRPGFGIKAKLLTIYGTLIIGGGNAAFSFKNSINIKIRKGGKIQDATATKVLKMPLNSVLFIYSGGGFAEAGTKIQSYSPSGVGESVSITSPTGPFTCAVLPNGAVQSAAKIKFFAVASGPFKTGKTFCGGYSPTADDCTDSPCDLEIMSGVKLSTADLNGQCDIHFDTFTISEGATCELGTPGSTSGFKFKFAIKLKIRGSLSFVCSGGGLLLAGGSEFGLYGTGKFSSLIATFIQVFDAITGKNIGEPKVLELNFSGPFFIVISLSGTITITFTDPSEPVTQQPTVAYG